MKKLIMITLAAAILTGCRANKYIPGSDFGYGEMQTSFTLAGVKVTGDEADWQWHSGTSLTAICERLLKEKYGTDFTAEQMVYYDEYSLCMHLQAYPTDDPDMVFSFWITGNDAPEIQWDNYYEALHEDEIIDMVYAAIADMGVNREDIEAFGFSLENGADVIPEIFTGSEMHLYMEFPDEKAAFAAKEKRLEFSRRIRDTFQPDTCFFTPRVSGEAVRYAAWTLSNNYHFPEEKEVGWEVSCWDNADEFTVLPLE